MPDNGFRGFRVVIGGDHDGRGRIVGQLRQDGTPAGIDPR